MVSDALLNLVLPCVQVSDAGTDCSAEQVRAMPESYPELP